METGSELPLSAYVLSLPHKGRLHIEEANSNPVPLGHGIRSRFSHADSTTVHRGSAHTYVPSTTIIPHFGIKCSFGRRTWCYPATSRKAVNPLQVFCCDTTTTIDGGCFNGIQTASDRQVCLLMSAEIRHIRYAWLGKGQGVSSVESSLTPLKCLAGSSVAPVAVSLVHESKMIGCSLWRPGR